MTYEEALELLDKELYMAEYWQDDHRDAIPVDLLLACKEAIEKQIPKKPELDDGLLDDNGKMIYNTWICPRCGCMYDINQDFYDWCPNCGQALDRRGM